ncbi:hypothetical protein EMCRGX_G029823 [Ephydatia muelleri]
MSAGLWTPRYIRLNMTEKDHRTVRKKRTKRTDDDILLLCSHCNVPAERLAKEVLGGKENSSWPLPSKTPTPSAK